MNIKLHKLYSFLTVFMVVSVNAQTAFKNFTAIKMHGDSKIGFHIDLINDGAFDNDIGLVGFYGYNKAITVSGSETPVFYDSEILADNNLYLETPIEILNNGNLITGNIVTPRNKTNVFTNFANNAFYVGEKDATAIDGYVAITNKDNFTFPVGDEKFLRPLMISSSITNLKAKCAYFFESPNTPSTFAKSYRIQEKKSEYLSISDVEFWHLEGTTLSSITLTWNERSDVRKLGQTIEDLKVVGWDKKENAWVDLGNTEVRGSMNSGTITSRTFTPNDYEIITIGGINDKLNDFTTIQLDNYFITPNGDGINDFLVLDGLENSPNNELKIFNRYGMLVYSKLNYQNDFKGISNRNSVISRNSGLASGVYFYIITMLDIKQRHQGYMYIANTND